MRQPGLQKARLQARTVKITAPTARMATGMARKIPTLYAIAVPVRTAASLAKAENIPPCEMRKSATIRPSSPRARRASRGCLAACSLKRVERRTTIAAMGTDRKSSKTMAENNMLKPIVSYQGNFWKAIFSTSRYWTFPSGLAPKVK